MKRRVVVTGVGIISCIGNDSKTVLEALRNSTSGIEAKAAYAEAKLRSQIAGTIKDRDALLAQVDRKLARFMGDSAVYAYLSMVQAIADSGIDENTLSDPRTGLIAGSGGGSPFNQTEGMDLLREKGVRRMGAFRVPRIMSSTVSANLATAFGIKGINYSITSACATSAHCIGSAAEQIAWGNQDVVFAGGGEEESLELTAFFDAMGALSSKYNDTPASASRAFDATRDGFVAAGGGAMLVLEEYEHAKARGANIYAELVGYGANSDGADMVAPSGEGAVRCMKMALADVDGPVDYVNAHGTSTPAGDITELKALRNVFGNDVPPISSTKSLTGHSLGATGAQEAIYSLLMMREGFIAGSAHIQQLDPEAEGFPIIRVSEDRKLNCVISNSFGFGGTNASLVFKKV
ncbi:MAG: beta-ketoacyl-ACP synthase I [Opitutales bacterium]|nr:beta-ketoacyl-ACP synthase I [Opitutales bacterium]